MKTSTSKTAQRDRDIRKFLERVALPGLQFALIALNSGQVTAGNFSRCIMAVLSYQDGRKAATNKYSFVTWVMKLAPEGKGDEFLALSRRLVRAFDLAREQDKIKLDPGDTLSRYYDQLYPDPGYVAGDSQWIQAISQEIARRTADEVPVGTKQESTRSSLRATISSPRIHEEMK